LTPLLPICNGKKEGKKGWAKEPVARMAKLLKYGKIVNGHNWCRFFALLQEVILLSLKPPNSQEWQEFLGRNWLEKAKGL